MAVMKRTTIMIPAPLKLKAEREARRLGVSLGQLIRQSLEEEINRAKTPRRRFFPGLDFSYTDDGPADLAENLDKYLDQWDEEDEKRAKNDASSSTRRKKRGVA